MPGIRTPGHTSLDLSDGVVCKCGWTSDAATKRSRRSAYAAHLNEARGERSRRCRDCGLVRDVKLMSVAKPDLCKSCATARVQRWKVEHPDEWERHRRRSHLKQKYGITVEQYDAILAAQGGVCAICGGHDADARLYKLHVDHDHATGAVRGLLCGACNRGIGSLGDDIARIERALEYLRR